MKVPSKICVCLGDLDRKSALEVLHSEALCELRLDLLPEIEPFSELLSTQAKLVITCRPSNKYSDSTRLGFFRTALKNSVYAIDLDLDDSLLPSLKEEILSSETKLILSYHNFLNTPDHQELHELRELAFKNGANIFKLATQVNTQNDALRILSLLEDKRGQVIVGMGELGKVVRVMAPYLGSLYSYVGTPNSKTAPGQLSNLELRECWKILGEPDA